jgi:DNA-binding transcriptional LysR family regulator
MTVFVAITEKRGFAKGAHRLGMSPPAVTRTIAKLESQLGV